MNFEKKKQKQKKITRLLVTFVHVNNYSSSSRWTMQMKLKVEY